VATVLVVYGSWAGSTAGVAFRLGKALTALGQTVKVLPAGSAPDPSRFDGVVVGSAIRSGEWHPAAKSWLTNHAPKLQKKPVAFFSVCLTPIVHPLATPEGLGYMLPIAAATGINPVCLGVFPGSYDPATLGLKERTRAKLWGAKKGDFRDMAAVDSWARNFSGLLPD
jgi:menaquinone-dependent protoporphyrinogen oxidase